ncbi:MAG: AGE family epimerase/isomerase [Acidobacteriota bacterium]
MILKLWQKRVYRPEALLLMAQDWLGIRHPVGENRFHLQEAVNWILRAQSATPDDGVCGGYSFEDGWIPSYPETTGYIIPTLLGYSKYSNNPLYRDRALAMAEWELTCQMETGAFPGHFVDRKNPPAVFNTGQVIFGLLAAYRATQCRRFLDAAVRAGRWLVSIQDADGAYRQYDYLGVAHSYNTRTAWAMIELSLETEDRSVGDAGLRHLEWALQEAQDNGWFRHAAFRPGEDPFLHTIAYVAQGLLEAGQRLGQSRYVAAAQRTCDTLLSHVDDEGFIPGAFDRNWNPTATYSCLTGNAQMAILWLRLHELTGEKHYHETATLTLRFLKSLQDCRTSNFCVRGAIKGSHPISGRYLFGTYPNWATKFFIDALLLEEALNQGVASWIECW